MHFLFFLIFSLSDLWHTVLVAAARLVTVFASCRLSWVTQQTVRCCLLTLIAGCLLLQAEPAVTNTVAVLLSQLSLLSQLRLLSQLSSMEMV